MRPGQSQPRAAVPLHRRLLRPPPPPPHPPQLPARPFPCIAAETATRVFPAKYVGAVFGTNGGEPTAPPPPASSAVRVNCGGNSYPDSQGRVWSADYGYSGGSTYSTSSWVSNTSDPTLYQTERYANGSFTYQFSVPNGNYTVNLKFADI